MRWGRFAVGFLPALPVVPVVIYFAIAGGAEPTGTDEPSTSIVTGPQLPGARPRASARSRPRLRASSAARSRPDIRPVPATRADGGKGPAVSSKASRCCAELKRYGRSSVHQWRGFYAKLAEQCRGSAELPDEADQSHALTTVRKQIAEQKAPYVPPSCRE